MPRNRIEDLRPIGTEFEVVSLPSLGSTDPRPHKSKYRIVGYIIGSKWLGDTEGEWLEEVEGCSVEVLPIPDSVGSKGGLNG